MADNKKNITLEQLRDLAERADKRLDKLEAALLLEKRTLLLPTSGWSSDPSDAHYPYQYALPVEGVTTASRVDAELDDNSIAIATACGLCAVCSPSDNAVIFRSFTAPTGDLSGIMYVTLSPAING